MFRARLLINVVIAVQMLLQPVLMALPPRPVQAKELPDFLELPEDAIALDMLPEWEAAMESSTESEPLYATVPVVVDDEAQAANEAQTETQSNDNFRSSPMMFIENVGQFDTEQGQGNEQPRFQVHGADGTIFLTPDAIWVTKLEAVEPPELNEEFISPGLDPDFEPEEETPRQGVNLKLDFDGANPDPQVEGFDLLDTTVSYFIGNDPDQWYADVPVWGGVRYVDIYPGIDLEITSLDGQWDWQMVVKDEAGAENLEVVNLRVSGADQLDFAGVGRSALEVQTEVGDFALPLLNVENRSGEEIRMPDAVPQGARPRIMREGVEEYNLMPKIEGDLVLHPLVFLPPNQPALEELDNPSALIYSTLLGGSGLDRGQSIAVDENGATYLTGSTTSNDCPKTIGPDYVASYDVFVAKLNSVGNGLTYYTYLGGNSNDWGNDIVVDDSGIAYVSGETYSLYFPVTAGTRLGNSDAFVVKLDINGGLLYSTLIAS